MKIKIKGQEKEVSSVIAIDDDRKLYIELRDERALPEIAAEFDGAETVKVVPDELHKAQVFEGYTKLLEIRTSEKRQITAVLLRGWQ